MKFGKSIGSQQDGNHEVHYVDYKLLKKRIKDVVVQLQANDLAEALSANRSFEEELASEIQKVNSCFGKTQQDLLKRTADLSGFLQVPAVGFADGHPDSLRRLVEILGEVDQLRKYAVWNAVAVVKILKKRRKQTNFGLEDTSAERAGWLSRQTFFSGSDFAELHAAIESLGHTLVLSELGPGGQAAAGSKRGDQKRQSEPQQCPICLDTISDMVELSCNHRFCWKCFVLGPIAHQPGEYRISQCPICRKETTDSADQDSNASAPTAAFDMPGSTSPSSEGVITRFLHTYFPQERSLKPVPEGEEDEDDRDMRDVVGELVKAIITDAPWGQGGMMAIAGSASGIEGCGSASSSSTGRTGNGSRTVGDFFQTLPQRQQEKQMGAAQKLQWLQLASNGDPLAIDGNMYCTVCSEPLLMEAVVTTPCKHHFHRVCISRLDLPQCPLCTSQLPFSWFVQADHPCAEHGFRVIPPQNYAPHFPGGPSKGSCGYPLHRPPPVSLHGPNGLVMTSYLHRIVPMGDALNEVERPASPSSPTAPDADPASSDSSSEDSGSDDKDSDAGRKGSRRRSRNFAWGVTGKMRLCEKPAVPPPPPGKRDRSQQLNALQPNTLQNSALHANEAKSSVSDEVPDRGQSRKSQVLLIEQHL